MSMSKTPDSEDLEIIEESKSLYKCPKCGGEIIKRVKSRRNKYTHKKCLNCGFGYIIG